jgi:acylphosphatase
MGMTHPFFIRNYIFKLPQMDLASRTKMANIRAHVFISGRVQGVFFRDKTQQLATSRGVNGWIRNLPDGRVEAVFEGEKEAVETLLAFCRKGPRDAQVADAEVKYEPFKGEFQSFEVTY